VADGDVSTRPKLDPYISIIPPDSVKLMLTFVALIAVTTGGRTNLKLALLFGAEVCPWKVTDMSPTAPASPLATEQLNALSDVHSTEEHDVFPTRAVRLHDDKI
jgi:hypothetical protein